MKVLLIALWISMSIFSAKANAEDTIFISVASVELSSMSLECLTAGIGGQQRQCQQNKDIQVALKDEDAAEKEAAKNEIKPEIQSEIKNNGEENEYN